MKLIMVTPAKTFELDGVPEDARCMLEGGRLTIFQGDGDHNLRTVGVWNDVISFWYATIHSTMKDKPAVWTNEL